jgi:ribosome-binding protein aMBF1 (putative translation factor)
MTRYCKTIDTWQIWVRYDGQHYEHECTEFTAFAAREQRHAYRVNAPEYPVRIKRRRERKSDFTPEQLRMIAKEIADALAAQRQRRQWRLKQLKGSQRAS